MAEPLGSLASRFGCELRGDPDLVVSRVATLANADRQSLSFLASPRYLADLETTRAAAVVLRSEDSAPASAATLISDDPYACYARIAAVLHPEPVPSAGIHPSAVVEAGAAVAATASVGANAFVAADAILGEHVSIAPGGFVGPGCRLGEGTRVHANVTLVRAVRLGERCIVHSGAVVGADGFGNTMTDEGWLKVPQLGGVRIGNDVEIGANTTIDCGAIDDTVIENGVRIDNLCQIAHNVHLGAHTALAAMVGIAGSVRIGKRCSLAGQVGVVGHISIADDVLVGGQAVVSKDITQPGTYAGAFVVEKARDWTRRVARFRRLDKLLERIKRLEKGGS